MLRSTVSRIRLCISAVGCVVLGASLFNWVQAQHAAGQQYAWVDVKASNAAAMQSAEIWQVSARCVRPYFVRAVMRSEAKLKAYYDLAPPEVRARLDRSPGPLQPAQPTGWYHLVNAEPNSRIRSDTDMEYVAQLHVQYAEWFANVFKLEIAASQWQQRLTDIADQRLVVSESARRSFGAYSGQNGKTASATEGFDDHVLAMLGLGGFSGDEEQALRSECVKINLVKEISQAPNYFSDLWRWPIEQAAAFAIGLELILIAIFLVPITLWIATGDPQVAAQHMRDAADRLRGRVRHFEKNKYIAGVLPALQAMRTRTRAVLADLGAWLGPAVNRQFQIFLTTAAALKFAIKPPQRQQWNVGSKAGVTAAARPFPRSRPRWRPRCTRVATVQR